MAEMVHMEILEEIREDCHKSVKRYAVLGAANAVNPIPGLDIGVDAGLCLRMMADMRARFGLSKDAASKLRHYDVLVPLVKKVFDFATKEGVMIVLKSFGKRYLGKTTAKYVPFIGQGIAAAAGYGMMRWFARQYIEDCYELARLADMVAFILGFRNRREEERQREQGDRKRHGRAERCGRRCQPHRDDGHGRALLSQRQALHHL